MIALEKIFMFSVSMPNRPAIVLGEDVLTWRELYSSTQACIQYIRQRFDNKIPQQACVVSPNRLELIPWMAAMSSLGVPTVGLDYTLSAQSIQRFLIELKVDVFIFSNIERARVGEVASFKIPSVLHIDLDTISAIVKSETKSAVNLEELIASRPAFRAIGLTSGTSGDPKVVVRTRSFDQQRFGFFTQQYNFGACDRFLVSMPLYHAAGNGWARMFMSLGATIYLASIDSPQDLAIELHKNAITATVMTPPLLDRVLDQLDTSSDSHTKLALRWVLVGGKHFGVSQKLRALKRLGKVVYEYYGTTETGVNTIAQPEDLLETPSSVGRSFEGNALAIINPDSDLLPPYKIGAVAVSSYMNMDHYANGTAHAVQIDGTRYLVTPDQGYLDKQGRLFLMNRAANANDDTPVYLLENEIRDLPCVADVALLCKANSVVDCAIVLRHTDVDVQHVLSNVRTLIFNRNLIPGDCHPLSAIPYSLTGKVREQILRSLLSTH